jgi:hypothetical protein
VPVGFDVFRPKRRTMTTRRDDIGTGGEPTGGYLAAYDQIPAAMTVGDILDTAIRIYVDPDALQVQPDDVNRKVVDRLFETIDRYGLGSEELAGFVARYQKVGTIRAGFYRICKDLGIKYAEWRVAQSSNVAQEIP